MINLYGLKYFYDSARFGSMTGAATLNHVSRPAISQAIKKLEEEIGVRLLNHKRRGFDLTPSGHLFMKNAEQIFAQVESSSAQLKQTGGPLRGNLKIGSARSLATFRLQSVFSKMRQEHQYVDLSIRIENSETLIKLLKNKEIDIAFLLGDEALDGYKQIVIGQGHFCLVKPKAMPINKVLYAITEQRPETDRVKTLFERKFSNQLPIFTEIPSWDAIWTWTSSGACGGLIPDFLISTKSISIVIDKVWPYEIKAIYSAARSSDPVIMAILQVIGAERG